MAFLVPGIRKQDDDLGQTLRCNLVCQNFDGIVADDFCIAQLPVFEAQHQAAHARTMHFDAQVVALGVRGRLVGEVVAVAEADLEGDGG